MIKAQTKKESNKEKEVIVTIESGIDEHDINSVICCYGPYTIVW